MHHVNHGYARKAKPQEVQAKDSTARILLCFVLVLLLINLGMTGYVFAVVHHMVVGLQRIANAFTQAGY